MKELKTKSELIEELEKDAEVIRKHFERGPTLVKIYEGISQRTLSIEIYTGQSGGILGAALEYRPNPVAPADGRAVMVRYLNNGKDTTIILLSKGIFFEGNERRLVCYDSHMRFDEPCFEDSPHVGWYYWCDYLNRDHHSPGWQKEWEPSE